MKAKLLSIPLAAALLALAVNGAAAATVVNVQLMDAGVGKPMATGLAYKAGAAGAAKATGMMVLSQQSAPAGDVTFNVKNGSHDLTHEMLVVKLDDPNKPLPYAAADLMVNEDQIKSLGEVSELDPGKTGKLTLNLKPGTYLLFCNVPGHFDAGMWTAFTVK